MFMVYSRIIIIIENVVIYMQVSVINVPNCTFYRLQASPYTKLFSGFYDGMLTKTCHN